MEGSERFAKYIVRDLSEITRGGGGGGVGILNLGSEMR